MWRPIPLPPPVTMAALPERLVDAGGYLGLATNWDLKMMAPNPSF